MTEVDAIWRLKEISQKEWDGKSSHVGFSVPAKVWGDVTTNFRELQVRFNGEDVFEDDAPVIVTKPHKSDKKRSETRVQSIRRLKEMGLRPGATYIRATSDRLEIEQGVRAWLVIAAGDERGHGGNDGYDDLDEAYYSWDDTVNRHKDVREGDMIVVRDTKELIGLSLIESIESGPATKILRKCPSCNQSHINPRKTAADFERWRCDDCKATCARPIELAADVTAYRSDHAAWWSDLRGLLSARELNQLVYGSDKQSNSIRPLRWNELCSELSKRGVNVDELPAVRRSGHVHPQGNPTDGFRERTTRTRVGQRVFREGLLERFDNTCALTGIQTPEVLQAAHLYSYAELGRHFDHGGLLMRADIHLLFDRGLVGIDCDSGESPSIVVSRSLKLHRSYWGLRGAGVHVQLGEQEQEWLRLHLDEFGIGD